MSRLGGSCVAGGEIVWVEGLILFVGTLFLHTIDFHRKHHRKHIRSTNHIQNS